MAAIPYTSEEFISLLQNAQKAFQSTVETFNQVIEYAKQASDSQIGAENAKVAADSSAAAADTAKDGAESAAKDAQASAEEAAQRAEAASQSANSAAGSAQTAIQYSGNPAIPIDGNWWIWDANEQEYKDSGKRAILNYDASYPSVEAMEADKDNQEINTLVVIASDVEQEDNAKTYILEEIDGARQWRFLADLSGMKGDTGPQGKDGPQGPKGDPFVYSDFTQAQLAALTGPQGPRGVQGPAGADGTNGADGKSAYQTAVEGGFVGTEAQFTEALGQVQLQVGTGTTELTAGVSPLAANTFYAVYT